MKPLSQLVFELDDALTGNGIPYAIGGALALAWYAEPRATGDIDLTVGTAFPSAASLVPILEEIGWRPEQELAAALPLAGSRFVRPDDTAVVDVFFSYDDYHATILHNAVRWPFISGGHRRLLPFLAADDLAVVKLSFNRPKDWVDLQAMLDAGTAVDADYVAHHLVAFRGPRFHPIAARYRRLVADSGEGAAGPPGVRGGGHRG